MQRIAFCYLSNGILYYDYLSSAMGCASHYFGKRNLASKSIPMKTLVNTLGMPNRLLETLEQSVTRRIVKAQLKAEIAYT